MKQLFFLSALLATILLLPSCNLDDDDDTTIGNWVRRSDFEGVPRSNAVAFVIDDLAFVGLGFDGDDDLRDFWQYDPAQDFWTRKDTFPGLARSAAVSFAVNGIGYVGTGYNRDQDIELQDFWAFDPNAASGQQWTQIADFPGTARYNAIAFALNGKGYVGTGFDQNWLKDFYRYDPSTASWEQIVSLGGSKRENAFVFLADDHAYVGGGSNNGAFVYDFWEFEPETETWTGKLDLDEEDDYDLVRIGATTFSLNGMGYLTTGSNGSNQTSTWEYLPTLDSWEEKTAFEGTSRQDAVGFTVAGRCYIATGSNGSLRFDDIWEFQPNEELDEDD